MIKQEKQKKTAVILLILITAVLVLVSTVFLVKKTEFAGALMLQETRSMLFEMMILFTLLFISAWHPGKRWLSHLLRVLVVLVFLWLHKALVPLLAAGLYLAYLYLLGGMLTGRAFSGKQPGWAGLITGMAAQIVIVCAFSAAGIGGTMFFLWQSLICFVLLLAVFLPLAVKKGVLKSFLTGKTNVSGRAFPRYREERSLSKDSSRLIYCLLAALIGTSFLLQAGRIGICLDYDSLHYGFRSAYVLDNGFGVYENLGSVNDVYVYPKGFEILTLPLAGFGSGAFVTAVSWWMTMVTVFGAATVVDRMRKGTGIGERSLKERKTSLAGVLAAAVLVTIPGIMNMAVSAKTDAVTLAVQMICVLCFLSEEKNDWWVAAAAAILSLTLKPTAFLFSFLLTVCGIGLCAYRLSKERAKFEIRDLIPAFLALAATLFVTARTVKLAGVPLTTAGGSLWNALGFTMKYPFNGASFDGGTEKSYLKRLIGLFACPAGEDMGHVYIAWGGLCVSLCLAATLAGVVFGKKQSRNAAKNTLLIMLLSVTAASLFLLRTLWQVDGNYFLLLYVLAVVSAFSVAVRPRNLTAVLAPAMVFGMALCCVTNWAGAKGLTAPALLHAGFPAQQKEQQLQLEAEGKGEIYAFLAEDPRNRVLALADQPACFAFPCNVQSYTDLEGSGGNVKLVKTLDEFKDFLDYAGTDYLYVEQAFLAPRERATDIVRYMLEDGSLVEELSAEGAGAALYRYTGVR